MKAIKELEFDLETPRFLFRRSGINETTVGLYAAFSPSGECLYLGKSTRLLNRILSHWRWSWHESDGKRVRRWIASGADFWHTGKEPYAPTGSKIKVWITDQLSDYE